MSFFSSDSFYILSKAFVFVKNFFIFLSLPNPFDYFSLAVYLCYHIQTFLSTTFKISYKFLSYLLINLFFELFLSQGLSASAPSSYSSVCSVVFSAVLSDECYLIIAISNCQCFLYISCNSEYSEKLASAFPSSNRFCKLACNKLVGLGNIGRMPLTKRTSVLSVATGA